MQSIFTENYKVRSTQINLNNRLGLYGVLGMLQDIAAEHASHLGFGYKELIQKGFFWALTQQKLKMFEYPKWNEQVTIKTWSLPVQGVYAFREFELFHGEKKIGECASTWITLDINTRKPIDISENQHLFMPRTDGGLRFKTERIALPDTMRLASKFNVKVSDLDVNRHVNNVKYAQWALDMIPMEEHTSLIIKEYDINFLSETFFNDPMEGYISEQKASDGNPNEVETYFYAQKTGVSKPAFISKWKAERILFR
ncbi:acyl-[acyl-carrier-protein] thioesterase [Capnocytophaga sp.]|uniref:acyl-[acyl-carrier-protein] thioesterase n=1 Tax=Capnocytophaga sp. TaxID=44737 RepID=UPI0026DAA5A7|nr:acyl-ACP thioesterase domain-containing protein [Capnocytophaga sp.]MDO5105240.1 thioesterase [Capnocytophaga sp.]